METTVDAPGLPFLNNDTLRLAEPHIQNMLNTRLRFLVKVAAQVQLAETVVDPVTEEASELDSDVWIPLGLWALGPLACSSSECRRRFRSFVFREAGSRLQFASQISKNPTTPRRPVKPVLCLTGLRICTSRRGNSCFHEWVVHRLL